MATAVPNGFELEIPGTPERTFVEWSLTDTGKDLILIDRIANMTPADFFYAAEDEHERERGPVLLGLMATSIRALYPDWSIERIIRCVMAVELGDVTWIGGDEDKPAPPVSPGGDEDTPEPSETQNGSAATTSGTSSEAIAVSSGKDGSESTTT